MGIKIMIFIKHQTRLLFLIFLIIQASGFAQITVHKNAHAHNDYKNHHPLTDALKNGFTSIEADVFLIKGKLVVDHTYPLVKKNKDFETLYLKPLQELALKNKGRIFENDSTSIQLLVDIKSDAATTYAALKTLLEKYKEMLSTYENGVFHERAVTIVLSGNKPFQQSKDELIRMMFMDESLLSCATNKYKKEFAPLASTHYKLTLNWNGKGKISVSVVEQLLALVETAHQHGKKVRLWAVPENELVWELLLDCGVDYISTDNLEKLNTFLKTRTKN
jgi:glycerophosphoryl diester phosphodiesterase